MEGLPRSWPLAALLVLLAAIGPRGTRARAAEKAAPPTPDEQALDAEAKGDFPLAQRLAASIEEFEGKETSVGALDIGLYRDDVSGGARPMMRRTDIPVNIEGQRVVLVDDVLYTGRSIRAAMDALTDFGRPREIQLAILVDRGHRELPIRADYVGKNMPTSMDEEVVVRMTEIDGRDEVVLVRKGVA